MVCHLGQKGFYLNEYYPSLLASWATQRADHTRAGALVWAQVTSRYLQALVMFFFPELSLLRGGCCTDKIRFHPSDLKRTVHTEVSLDTGRALWESARGTMQGGFPSRKLVEKRRQCTGNLGSYGDISLEMGIKPS